MLINTDTSDLLNGAPTNESSHRPSPHPGRSFVPANSELCTLDEQSSIPITSPQSHHSTFDSVALNNYASVRFGHPLYPDLFACLHFA